MQNQARSGFPGRQTLREAFMLGGMGAAFSKDIPRALGDWRGLMGVVWQLGWGSRSKFGGGLCWCHGSAQYGAWQV